MAREVVIKTCLRCGHTQRLPYENFDCPSCHLNLLAFFKDIDHLIYNINLYGLKNKRIIDDDVREKVIKAFGGGD